MAAPAVAAASLSENQESPGLNHTGISANSAQKRGHEDVVADGGDKRWPGWPGDNVFRLIVPVQKVGSIIGRKGEFVKKMCEETKSRIKVLDGIHGTAERVVMVFARDEPEAAVSPAMDGLLKVHWRTIDGTEGEGDPNAMRTPAGAISSRLLVAATQAGSLIGRQGATIRSIQDTSGAIVRIMPAEDLPYCALQDDRVVEIQGEPPKVHRAVELVVSHLRKFLVDRSVLPLFELNRTIQTQSQHQTAQTQSQQQTVQTVSHASWGASAAAALPSTTTPGLGGASHYTPSSLQHDSYYQTSDLLDSQNLHHGVSMYGRDPGVGLSAPVAAPPPAPVITQVTQHMQIPLLYADAIIGTAGANVSYMRRTSGATITIQESKGFSGEMTVEIYGTATQVQTAQQLVQNFMAGASAPPTSSYNSVDAAYGSYNPQSSLYSSAAGTAGHSTGTYGSSYNSNYAY